MGIYYFAVDYNAKEQMWAPEHWSYKCIYHPRHPLPHMVVLKNCYGSQFEIVSDCYAGEEYNFKNVTNEVYEQYKNEFPNFNWESYETKGTEYMESRIPLTDLRFPIPPTPHFPMAWISVKDKLPEKEGEILVVIGGDILIAEVHSSGGFLLSDPKTIIFRLQDKKWIKWDALKDPTYWMPLPEAPK